MEYSSCFGLVKYHLTPWNSRAVLGQTLEIDGFDFDGLENGIALIRAFSDEKEKAGFSFFVTRVVASDKIKKQILQDCGFYIVEHTLDAVYDLVDSFKFQSIVDRFPVDVSDFQDSYADEISEIAYSQFKFGRFSEDPYISDNQAQNRNKYWVQDLISLSIPIKIVKKKSKVVGFIAYRIDQGIVELILGAVLDEYRHLSYSFWATVINQVFNNKSVVTRISSSNIDVLNLYSYFGFRLQNPQFGFHKQLSSFKLEK